MKIELYVDNELYASRDYSQVPREGDLIQLGLDLYEIDTVVWCDPDRGEQVTLFAEPYRTT